MKPGDRVVLATVPSRLSGIVGTVLDVGGCGWPPCKNETCVVVRWDGKSLTENFDANKLKEAQ